MRTINNVEKIFSELKKMKQFLKIGENLKIERVSE